MSAPVEETFGPYAVFERLGMGGMATVHRAKKQGIEGFERVVALKRLLTHLADDDSFVRSFIREARLASLLQHANIVQIYDLGRVDGNLFIAMEYIDGHDLRQLLRQAAFAVGPMPIGVMLALFCEVCEALDYAHTMRNEAGEPLGLVHRDISPSNVIVGRDGHAKIIDFGIARATEESLRSLTNRVKGKFSYMSPEVMANVELDGRSDLFSLGVVAWEMLTARPLFASRSQVETIKRVRFEEAIPPSRYNPDCPPALDDIILTALVKQPDERWQSAAALRNALDHLRSARASNREVADWVRYAFSMPRQRRRWDEPPTSIVAATPTEAGAPRSSDDVMDDLSVSIEIVWGQDEASADQQTQPEIGLPLPGYPPPDGSAPALWSTGASPVAHGPPPPVAPTPSPIAPPAMAAPSEVHPEHQQSTRTILGVPAAPRGTGPVAAPAPVAAAPPPVGPTPAAPRPYPVTQAYRAAFDPRYPDAPPPAPTAEPTAVPEPKSAIPRDALEEWIYQAAVARYNDDNSE